MPDRDGLYPEPVAQGVCHSVWMTTRVYDEYSTWSAEARAGLFWIMEVLAIHGHANLNDTQFRAEERITPKGSQKSVMVYAVKNNPHRLYGVFDGKRFICTAFDEKKKRRADMDELRRAADRFERFRGGSV